MKVPMLSIVFMVLNLLIGILIPLVLAICFKKKYKASLLAFFVGCLVMFVFAFVLEQMVHALVLFVLPFGKAMQSNFWIMAVYGGLMAALFEETGRLLSMRFWLGKKLSDPHNALMYGAGHGGFEAFAILTMGMINNIIYSVCINTGATEIILAPLDEANKQTLQAAFDTLTQTSPLLFLASPIERFAAVTAQIGLSVLVWFAATKVGKMKWYVVALVFHFTLDALAVILSGLGMSIVLIEVVVWILALVIAYIAWMVWKKETGALQE